jgi:hypothetical protein
MAFKKSFKGKRPQYSISTSVAVRKGKYVQGPSFGLWDNDGKGPMARGSVKEDYLGELISFLRKAEKNEQSVSFALFKNKLKKSRDEDDDDDEDEDEDEEDEKEDEDEDEDEEDEKPAKKKSSKKENPSKGKGKDKKKSGKDWDFDDDEDDDD